jgi:hypothetical protein
MFAAQALLCTINYIVTLRWRFLRSSESPSGLKGGFLPTDQGRKFEETGHEGGGGGRDGGGGSCTLCIERVYACVYIRVQWF